MLPEQIVFPDFPAGMIDDKRTMIDSFFIPPLLIFTGLITAPIPKINRIFAMQEPTMLPSEIPASCSNPAPTETASSGDEVPNPMIIAETIKTGIPYLSAVFDAPSTRISDPLISKMIHAINRGIA